MTMRVSQFSTLSSTVLLLVSITLAAALYFSLAQLRDANQKIQDYQTLKASASIDLSREVNGYLSTGNTLRLSAAETLLQNLAEDAKRQNLVDIQERLNQLAQAMQSRYRALGKLSGNEMGLLTNAERQMIGYADSAVDYGIKAIDLQKRGSDYINHGSEMLALLAQLTMARQSYFADATDVSHQAYKAILTQLRNETESLAALPMLGILEESEVDEFALGEPEPAADLAEEFKSELQSLSRRYLQEINNTNALLEKRQALRQALADEVTQLSLFIHDAEMIVLTYRHNVTQRVEATLYSIAGVLIALAIISQLALRKYVLTPLRSLRDGFKALVDNGEFVALKGASKDTEISQIARYFNQVLDTLSSGELKKRQQLNVVSGALDSVSEQIRTIHHNAQQTEQQVGESQQLMEQLRDLTEHLNQIAGDLESDAAKTESAMDDSKQHVETALKASQQTSEAVGEGLNSLTSVMHSVDNVSVILGVIKTVAEQTNLLALNAAIEAARAGEHGRGFSVVADEVRSLAMKTQTSLEEVTGILDTLKNSSNSLELNINGIQRASNHQQSISNQLMTTTEDVRLQAQSSAQVASRAGDYIRQQSQYVAEFTGKIENVKHQVESTYHLATKIERDVSDQVDTIVNTLAAKH
jgi:methyl-accepting chemotaxis protein